MKYLILCFLMVGPLYAAELKIEPIYGFERNYHAEPKPARYRTEIFLGVRSTYGTPTIAGEAELSQSNSDDEVSGVKAKYSTQSLMLGVRLVPISGEYYSIFFRSGVRAQKKTTELTQNGETTSTTDGPNMDPYAGGGIGINVGGMLTVNASATLVYNRNAEASEQYDTRYTLGAGFKFGNR